MLHFELTDDKREVGFYSGLVITSFMLGRMLSSLPLGILSDRWGRRPVVELGLWSCLVFGLAFGLAPSFGMALTARFLMGLLNGIIGVSKAWLPDLAGPEWQTCALLPACVLLSCVHAAGARRERRQGRFALRCQ